MINNIIMELRDIFSSMKTSMDDVVVIDGCHIIFIAFGSKLSVATLATDTKLHIVCRFYDIAAAIKGEEFRYNYNLPEYYQAMDTFIKYACKEELPLVVIDNFEKQFPDLVRMKSSDVQKVINAGGIGIMMIPGILNLTKSDTASLSIYANGEYTHLIKFDVAKKKIKTTISIYLVQFKLF